VKHSFLFLVIFLSILPLSAQDFGFGFDDAEDPPAALNGLSASIHGEVTAALTGYIDDFSSGPNKVNLGDIFSGKLNFSAGTSFAEGIINLKLKAEVNPIAIDEAYLRLFLGNLELEGGLRKLSWGKADSLGPLDVINPLDLSAIYPEMADNNDPQGMKVARPLIHASLRLGQWSKLETVFLPSFEPHRLAASGHWAQAVLLSSATAPDTTTLDYAQAGLRYSTTIGSSDIGAQYYYGRLPQPAVVVTLGMPPSIDLAYNPYHQIGIDYAQVVFGFNLRAEAAANITKDLKGDDGAVYNPAIVWSLGFDRDLVWGINLNIQANQSVRLFHDKVGSADFMSGNFDTEGGTDPTATRITAALSKKFLRDELELRAAAVWGVEDRDFVIMPALIWTKDAVTIACSGGFFGGDEKGQLGQYHKNNFLKLRLGYAF
jgi:hypothetical protein